MNAALTSTADNFPVQNSGETQFDNLPNEKMEKRHVNKIPILPSNYEYQKFGIYIANLNWVI